MSREQSLLARINDRRKAAPRVSQPSATENLDALMESVRQHLAKLLNSRHGMSECVPDYGLPAMSDLTTAASDYSYTVERAIQNAIEKYEPRLRRPRVTRIVDEDKGRSLSFRVEGTLVGKSGQHRVWYETSISGAGQFEVEG